MSRKVTTSVSPLSPSKPPGLLSLRYPEVATTLPELYRHGPAQDRAFARRRMTVVQDLLPVVPVSSKGETVETSDGTYKLHIPILLELPLYQWT